MVEKENKPVIRFKGFTDEWLVSNIGKLTLFHKQGFYTTESYDKSKKYFLLRGTDLNNNQLVLNNTPKIDATEKDFNDFKVCIGDVLLVRSGNVGTYGIVYNDMEAIYGSYLINFRFDQTMLKNEFFGCFYQSKLFKNQLKKIIQQSANTNINAENIKSVDISLAHPSEQIKIGAFFQNLDSLITLHQRKYDKLLTVKKSMLEKMFPKEGADVPEIRFNGFTGKWVKCVLGEIMNVTSVKRIHQSDWTDSGVRFLRARDIVSAAKNEKPSDSLFITQEKYDEYSAISGKVSIGDMLVTGVGTIGIPLLIRNSDPLYFKDGNIIWFQNNGKIKGDFFYYSFIGRKIQDFINESAGIGTVGTYTIESGKKTPILIPVKDDEQSKIGSFFLNLDNLISLQQHELIKLKNIKKTCLEKMFV